MENEKSITYDDFEISLLPVERYQQAAQLAASTFHTVNDLYLTLVPPQMDLTPHFMAKINRSDTKAIIAAIYKPTNELAGICVMKSGIPQGCCKSPCSERLDALYQFFDDNDPAPDIENEIKWTTVAVPPKFNGNKLSQRLAVFSVQYGRENGYARWRSHTNCDPLKHVLGVKLRCNTVGYFSLEPFEF